MRPPPDTAACYLAASHQAGGTGACTSRHPARKQAGQQALACRVGRRREPTSQPTLPCPSTRRGPSACGGGGPGPLTCLVGRRRERRERVWRLNQWIRTTQREDAHTLCRGTHTRRGSRGSREPRIISIPHSLWSGLGEPKSQPTLPCPQEAPDVDPARVEAQKWSGRSQDTTRRRDAPFAETRTLSWVTWVTRVEI
jgi:hypothetical protein